MAPDDCLVKANRVSKAIRTSSGVGGPGSKTPAGVRSPGEENAESIRRGGDNEMVYFGVSGLLTWVEMHDGCTPSSGSGLNSSPWLLPG